ncbi:hypothetical protein [Undibacterium sp. SXout20W]|uniref:hypothetical protein n=1 Tax=Undibacterium sp. SXout20W TaxID=3413051 RepID=UPI003BF4008C
MKQLTFFLCVTLVMATPLTYAEQKSVCSSFCNSEKKQCYAHGEAQAKDDLDPIIKTNTEKKTGESMFEYQHRQSEDLRNLIAEKRKSCDVANDQCLASCRKNDVEKEKTVPPFKTKEEIELLKKETMPIKN